ncbi:MAG: hypothetical protein ACJ74O_05845 [Frankiaceae bacterium]
MAKGDLSRRRLLAGAGLAVAGGVGLAGATAGPAAAEESERHGRVGVARGGATACEFRSRVAQSGSTGETFTSYGYLTAAHGAGPEALFAGSRRDESTALLTAYAAGALVQRILDMSVHALDIEGTLTVYQRSAPGASFDDPSSFQEGTPVATFALTLQDILAVFAPAQGIPTLTGDMRQTAARALSGPLAGRRFGRVGLRGRFFATGLGRLVDPVTLNALLELAGNWTVEQSH